MFRFIVGFITAVVLILLALFCYVRFGFVDPRADLKPGSLETKLAMPALDASVDRRAYDMKNPVPLNEEDLLAGMKIYQADCAGCHGDISHPHSAFGDSFYPRVPQFVEDAPDMPENQNSFIIQHGVRFSGMPGWKTSLKESEIWQVTTFLSHMDKFWLLGELLRLNPSGFRRPLDSVVLSKNRVMSKNELALQLHGEPLHLA